MALMSACAASRNITTSGHFKYTKVKPSPILRCGRLSCVPLTTYQVLIFSVEYARYCAGAIDTFIKKNHINKNEISLLAQHGHTVFHQPAKGFTLQIGCEAELAVLLDVPVVCDFRSQDVALGGQGAPLVPIGDKLLFNEYQACLNLGGFANISFEDGEERMAFDVCPVNFILNPQAKQLGQDYDDGGKIAAQSEIDEMLLRQLDQLEYYRQKPPKSLGQEWVEEQISLLVSDQSPQTLLATFSEHAARQIAFVLNDNQVKNCLISGGGALNTHLLNRIRQHTGCGLEVAQSEILHFKEALIFAFMGLLRMRGEINIISSVTGARRSHSSGVVYKP